MGERDTCSKSARRWAGRWLPASSFSERMKSTIWMAMGFSVFMCLGAGWFVLWACESLVQMTLPVGLQRADPLPFLCSPWPGVLFSKKRVLNDFIFA